MTMKKRAASAVAAAGGGNAENLSRKDTFMHSYFITDVNIRQAERAERVLTVVLRLTMNYGIASVSISTLSCILLIPEEELRAICREYLDGLTVYIARKCRED